MSPVARGAQPTRIALVVMLFALGVACSDDKSFVVVSVYSSLRSIDDVAQFRVNVTDGPNSEQILYPEKPLDPTAVLRLDPNTPIAKPVTFSVTFSSKFNADVTIDVEALDPNQVSLGTGTSAPVALSTGQVSYAYVYVNQSCDPRAPASCGNGYTCALVCDQNSQPKSLCFSAGTANPGESCTDTTDCVPGSACFEFNACSTAAQPRKTCRQFCNVDSDCGVGARSFCNTGVSCDQTSTSFRLCSRPCDPTGDATVGCAAGLLCFIYSGEITDCACLDQSRVGTVGVSCAADENCQPGLMCVDRSGAKSCQAICRLDVSSCAAGKTCTQLTNPDYQVYGACL